MSLASWTATVREERTTGGRVSLLTITVTVCSSAEAGGYYLVRMAAAQGGEGRVHIGQPGGGLAHEVVRDGEG